MRSSPSTDLVEPRGLPSRPVAPEGWRHAPARRLTAAMLLAGPDATAGVEPLRRAFASALPEADVLPYVGTERTALVRRMFVEISADAYVVADETRDPVALARAVAAVARDGADLVVVTALPDDAFADIGNHVLTLTLDYLFDCGAGPVDAVAVACSRRFAQSYAGDGSLLDLALHALRRRMPIAEIQTLDRGVAALSRRRPRRAREWLALAGLMLHLLAEERPRRTFGLAGIVAIAAGFASATPVIRIHDWHAGLLPGWDSILSLGLTGAGVGAMAAGLLLDAMIQARQDVSRIGYQAIPLGPADQSSVS